MPTTSQKKKSWRKEKTWKNERIYIKSDSFNMAKICLLVGRICNMPIYIKKGKYLGKYNKKIIKLKWDKIYTIKYNF